MSRGLFGWSLPPGVTQADIDRFSGEDTVQLPRCATCGGFLRMQPDRREPWEDGMDCDGSEMVLEYEYTEEMVAVLGDSFRGATYTVGASPCGIEVGPHDPHRVIHMAGFDEYRTCRKCGAENCESVF